MDRQNTKGFTKNMVSSHLSKKLPLRGTKEKQRHVQSPKASGTEGPADETPERTDPALFETEKGHHCSGPRALLPAGGLGF